ncbi:Fatty acid hydroxylase [Penicillium expansum]|nr:Fatty acid hydroxylase [Penicillium expansum]
MDIFLDILDTLVLNRCYALLSPDPTATFNNNTLPAVDLNRHVRVYYPMQPSKWAEASLWKRDDIARQALSLYVITWLFAMIMYLLGSLLLYHTLFDKRLLKHPRFLQEQIKLEINQGVSAIPVMTLLTVPFFLAEIRGWSKLYDFTSDSPFFGYTLLQYPLFICFTDSGIYWIHRGLHHPIIYRWLHKPHHKWAVPTPFASYAFSSAGWMVAESALPFLPFTTAWDRLGGTYRRPKGDSFMESQEMNGKEKVGNKRD